MDIIIFFILTALFSLGGQCTGKLNSNHLAKSGKAGLPLFYAINSFVACLFFLASSGFRLSFTPATGLFALLYAGVVLLALFSNLWALRVAEISNVSVVSGAGNLLLTSAMSFLFFKEALSPTKLIRILLMLAGVFLIFLERRTKGKSGRGFLPAMAGMLGAGLGNSLVLKFYGQASNVADDSSFFFFTNAILALFAIGWLLLQREPLPRALLHPFALIPFAGNTLCSNAASLIALQLITRMELSVYTPLTGALGCVINLLASLLFKEKLGICSYLAAVLSLIAIII